jgi:hypothetical protein
MNARILVFGGGATLAPALAYSVIAAANFDGCGLSDTAARGIVVEELVRLGLDQKYLSGPERDQNSCSFSFDFNGQGRKLNYVVTATSHSVDLTFWDYEREEAEHAGSQNGR